VLYVCFEDDEDEIERRIEALCIAPELKREDLANFHYHVIKVGDVASKSEKGKLVEGSLVARLTNAIKKGGYGVVILDPFVNTHECEENDNSAINFVKKILVRLASDNQIAIDIPHHVLKGQREAGNADNWRGAGSLRDGIRLGYTLTRMSEEEAKSYQLDENGEYWRYIRVDSAKANITRGGALQWFKLISVPLKNGTDLYPTEMKFRPSCRGSQ
jgi:RecA-family ATPase